MAKRGRPRKIESTEQMYDMFEAYKKERKNNPRIKYHLNQRSGDMVGEPLEVPLTMEGQGQDTDNLAAHIIAVETLLTVVLRQIPIDIAEVRKEALRRSESAGEDRGQGNSMVADICEDILRRADD